MTHSPGKLPPPPPGPPRRGATLLSGEIRNRIVHGLPVEGVSEVNFARILLDHRDAEFGGHLQTSRRTTTSTTTTTTTTEVTDTGAAAAIALVTLALVASVNNAAAPANTDVAQAINSPPRHLEVAFRILLPARVRDAILGDAQEAFNDTLQRSQSRRIATADYAKEILYAIISATWMRLEKVIALLRRGS